MPSYGTLGAVFGSYQMDQKLSEWCEDWLSEPWREKPWTVALWLNEECGPCEVEWVGELPLRIPVLNQSLKVVRFRRVKVDAGNHRAEYVAVREGDE